MGTVTVKEIVEALVKCGSSALNNGLPNTAKYLAGLADRIEAHGIAPPDGRTPVAWAIETPYGRGYSFAEELLDSYPVPDGMMLVTKEPTCWAVSFDGKLNTSTRVETTVFYRQASVKYWTDRGFVAIPLYSAPGVKS